MIQYTIKRLLLTIPTFFAISLIIFLVLNVAPGKPGAQSSGQGESTTGQEQKESYRIFKEQFNLDRPILLNTRFNLDTAEVREMLAISSNLSGEEGARERIEASDDLDDYGNYLVQHLLVLLDDADPEIRRLAANQLTAASQSRFVNDRRGDAEAAREQNREIGKANDLVKTWGYTADAPDADKLAIHKQWKDWYSKNEETYVYSAGEKLSIFFTDTRFFKYWDNLLHLDFGVSTVDRKPVLDTVLSKLKYSLSLTTTAVILAYIISVPTGIFSAVKQGKPIDSVITVLLFVMYSLPTFFTGTVLLKLLSEGDPVAWFPTGNFQSMDVGAMTTWQSTKDIVWHLILPIATYTSTALAALSRYARTGVIDVIRADYIRTARAKGLSEPVVILKHAVRNGMIPVLTLLGGLLPTLVAGSVVIEVIFNIPGMGQFLFSSINLRDYNAVMAVLLASSSLALMGILLSDLSYALVDPRISFD